MQLDDDITPVMAVVPVKVEDRPLETQHIPYNQSPFHVRHNCEKCNVECWVGPKQLTMKNLNSKVIIICINCLIDMQKSGLHSFEGVNHLGG